MRSLKGLIKDDNSHLQLLSFFHALVLILTCQRRKSLRRTSPEVRMSRSGLGELLLYKHSLSNVSETSLSTTEQHKHSLLEQQLPGSTFSHSLLHYGRWYDVNINISSVWSLLLLLLLFTLLWSGPAPLPKPFLWPRWWFHIVTCRQNTHSGNICKTSICSVVVIYNVWHKICYMAGMAVKLSWGHKSRGVN